MLKKAVHYIVRALIKIILHSIYNSVPTSQIVMRRNALLPKNISVESGGKQQRH